MDAQRAREILDSIHMVQVHYRGIPVYIERLNDDHTATVFPLDEMDNSQQVDLAGLEEIEYMKIHEDNESLIG